MSNKPVKRVLVTFTAEQWKILETLKGELGRSDADVVRNIIVTWLINKNFLVVQKKGQFLEGEINE
jgi:hypothetical protein